MTLVPFLVPSAQEVQHQSLARFCIMTVESAGFLATRLKSCYMIGAEACTDVAASEAVTCHVPRRGPVVALRHGGGIFAQNDLPLYDKKWWEGSFSSRALSERGTIIGSQYSQ